MPHVIVKMFAGRSAEQKAALAEAVTKAVMQALGSAESAVSVGIEDVAPERWTAEVYQPDILDKPESIYKQPGYKPS